MYISYEPALNIVNNNNYSVKSACSYVQSDQCLWWYCYTGLVAISRIPNSTTALTDSLNIYLSRTNPQTKFHMIYESHQEKICIASRENLYSRFQPGLTQTGLYTRRRWLEA